MQEACRNGNWNDPQIWSIGTENIRKREPRRRGTVAAVVCRRCCKHVLSWAMQPDSLDRSKEYEEKGTETGSKEFDGRKLECEGIRCGLE
jgi:hypothetical protein